MIGRVPGALDSESNGEPPPESSSLLSLLSLLFEVPVVWLATLVVVSVPSVVTLVCVSVRIDVDVAEMAC